MEKEGAMSDFGFFIRHMLAQNRIEFLDLHLLGLRFFVFRRGVKMARFSRRHQFNVLAHDILLK
jgi:hypothetical protein